MGTNRKNDPLTARLTRGSQPARRREKGTRFSKQNQPKGPRGRPRGSANRVTRELREAILIAYSELGEDLHGKGGLVGFFKRIGRRDLRLAAMFLRALIPTQMAIEEKKEIIYQSTDEARADLRRAGIHIDEIFRLEHVKSPIIDGAATEVTNDSRQTGNPAKDDERR